MRNLEWRSIAGPALRRIFIYTLLLLTVECAVITLESVLCQLLTAIGHGSEDFRWYLDWGYHGWAIWAVYLQVPGILAGGIIVGLLNPRHRWSAAWLLAAIGSTAIVTRLIWTLVRPAPPEYPVWWLVGASWLLGSAIAAWLDRRYAIDFFIRRRTGMQPTRFGPGKRLGSGLARVAAKMSVLSLLTAAVGAIYGAFALGIYDYVRYSLLFNYYGVVVGAFEGTVAGLAGGLAAGLWSGHLRWRGGWILGGLVAAVYAAATPYSRSGARETVLYQILPFVLAAFVGVALEVFDLRYESGLRIERRALTTSRCAERSRHGS
jgi:hypothetical protein